MKYRSITMLGAAALFAVSLQAGTVTLDGDLANGVYFGHGNSNGHYTIDTENGVEVGLRAGVYHVGPVTPTGSTYNVGPGLINPTHATWNYEFSVDLTGSGLTLSDVYTSLSITGPDGNNTPFDVLTIGDNDLLGVVGAQNSENPIFGLNTADPLYGKLGPATYNPFSVGLYTVSLSVFNKGTNALLASDSINVNVTPEPATFAMIGGGLGLLALSRRRKK